MTESFDAAKKLIEECTKEERVALARSLQEYLPPHPLEEEWEIDSNTILSAIQRSTDLTKRGVRGVIAEAVFLARIVPTVTALGWKEETIPIGNWPYDALVRKGNDLVRIQVKLQRLEAHAPKRYYPRQCPEELFVVEVQKTRTGRMRARSSGTNSETRKATRPYRFGDFDILAVNMHPTTRNWTDFRYTVADWLLPRPDDSQLIEIFQPVSLTPNAAWTDEFAVSIEWLLKGEKRRVLDSPHTPHRKARHAES